MMIDDRIREAAIEFRREMSVPIPEFKPSSGGRSASRLVTVTAAIASLAAVAGVGALLLSRPESPSDIAPTQASVDAATTITASSETVLTPAPSLTATSLAATTAPAEPRPLPERVTDTELTDFIGTYLIDYQTATTVLGSTGTVTYTLDMTESSFCLLGCQSIDDHTPLPEVPESLLGGGGSSATSWYRGYITPEGMSLQIFDATGPACEMHHFALQPYGDAVLWACENTGPAPELLDLVVTKGERSLVATMERSRVVNGPISDPATTTGYRIGDTPDTAEGLETLPYVLVIDQTDGTVAGYVRRHELDTPTFDGITLVYDEGGQRIGELGGNWQLASFRP